MDEKTDNDVPRIEEECAKNVSKKEQRCANETECAAAISRALETTDTELFEVVSDHIIKLIAALVPFGMLSIHTYKSLSHLPPSPHSLSLSN